MNRQLPTITFLALMFFGLSTGLHAQSIGIAPGITYRMEDKLGGAHLRAYYHMPKWLSLGAEFSYYLPELYEGDPVGNNNFYTSQKNVWAIDLNAHIDLRVRNIFNLYPLVGVNFSKIDDTGGGTFPDGSLIEEVDANSVGFNVGGGLHLFPDQMGPFFEYKYILGKTKQRVLTGGFVFIINLGNESKDFVEDHEDPRLK